LGNVMLLILNLPLIGMWVSFLRIPYTILFPLILLFCLIGAYTVDNRAEDLYVMMVFGLIGYLMRKYEYDTPPLILAFILCPLMETNLRRTLIISDGNPAVFFQRPISAGLLGAAIFFLAYPILLRVLKKRKLPGLQNA
jgi:putative tricarboxylic transport membrane protein